MPEQLRDQLDRVPIPNFWGLDARRNLDSNEQYGVAAYCENLGRDRRAPLHPRRTLRRLSTPDGSHEQHRQIKVLALSGVAGSIAAAMLDVDGNVRFARGIA